MENCGGQNGGQTRLWRLSQAPTEASASRPFVCWQKKAQLLCLLLAVMTLPYPSSINSATQTSIFMYWLLQKFNGLDILINNAGVRGHDVGRELWARHEISIKTLIANPSLKEGIIEDYERARVCIETNYFGTKRIVKTLLPLLKPSPSGSRIVNISSITGLLKFLGNEAFKIQLSDVENLKEEMIDDFVNNYLDDFQSGQTEGKGWPSRFGAYCVSKMAVNAYTRLLARDFGRHREHGHEVYVNCIRPGSVKTDLTYHEGELEPAESATFVAGLALSPPGGPSGQYFDKSDIGSF